MTTLHVVSVFVAADGGGGNLLGVFLDGAQIAPGRRQAVAHELGYSETVFVDEVTGGTASARIFTPGRELRFAGHPTVGTSWLLRREGRQVDVLRVPAGDVATWQDAELTWVRARAAWIHAIEITQLASPAAVDALDPRRESPGYRWAWIDEPAGIIRSRYLASDVGILEDEATGAAAVLMGDLLDRPLLIRQGRGSELHTRPGPEGTVEVGGRVEPAEDRPYD